MPGNRRSWAAAAARREAERARAEAEIVDAEIVDEDGPQAVSTELELHASRGLAPRAVGDTIYLQLLRPVVGYGQAGDTLQLLESVQTEAMVAEGLAVVVSSPTGPVVAQAPTSIKWQPFTRYPAGWVVINPAGQIVSANVDFVSGGSYVAGNWTLVNDVGAGSVKTVAGQTPDGGGNVDLSGVYAALNPPLSGVTRDPSGRVTAYTENGVASSLTRDSSGRVATVTTGGVTRTANRDASGRIASVT